MADKEKLDKKRVQWSGPFDFGKWYQLTYDLFSEFNYEIYEKKYLVDTWDRAMRIEWECFKNLDRYSRSLMNLTVTYVAFGKTNVSRGGERVELETGDIRVDITAYLVTDYMGKWSSNPILSYLKEFYERYIYGDVISSFKEQIERELWNIAEEEKKFFRFQKSVRLKKPGERK